MTADPKCFCHWKELMLSALAPTLPSLSLLMDSKRRKHYRRLTTKKNVVIIKQVERDRSEADVSKMFSIAKHTIWDFLKMKVKVEAKVTMLISTLLLTSFQTHGKWWQDKLCNCFRHAGFMLCTETATSFEGNDSLPASSLPWTLWSTTYMPLVLTFPPR